MYLVGEGFGPSKRRTASIRCKLMQYGGKGFWSKCKIKGVDQILAVRGALR